MPAAPARSDRDTFLIEVYQNHWGEICRYVRRNFGAGPPEPEDVAQTAFTKFAALENPLTVRNPRAFLITTARNIVIDHYKVAETRNGQLKQISEDRRTIGALFDNLTPERILLAKEKFGLLRRVLEHMPEKRRELLLLRRVHGMSYVELSNHTGLSQTTVKYHVAMGLSDCLSVMGEVGLDAGEED